MELSTRLKVRTLRDGEVKIFKLCSAGRIDPATNAAAYNQGGTFEGYYTIFDKFEKDRSKAKKIIKNVTGTSIGFDDKGKEKLEEVVSPIEFNSKGICVVKHDEYPKLICLTRANENGSNPFRDHSKPAIWEEMDSVQTRTDIMAAQDLIYYAETIARNCDISKEAAPMAKKLLNQTFKDPSELRFALINFAKDFPKDLIRASKDKEMKLKIMISDAVHHNLIELTDGEEWIYKEDNGEDRVIVAVPVGSEPYTILVNHLSQDKQEYNKISGAVEVFQPEMV